MPIQMRMTVKKQFLVSLIWLAQSAFAQSNPITMAFVGDMMLDETPGQYIKQGKDPFKAFESILDSSDISIGNLECAVGTSGKKEDKPYTFMANPRVIPVLKKHFSAVSLANNHSFDYGTKAFDQMLDLLDSRGLRYFGAGRNIKSAHQPAIFEVKGKRVAILGYSEFFPRSFEALDDRSGIAWSEDDYVVYDIKQAKEKYQADYVIVFPHWGIEHEKFASTRQVNLAHLMIDSGADAVIGGHPHVTQNIETYKNKPIFYSLGNFVFNGFDDDDSNTGWVVRLTLEDNQPIKSETFVAKLDMNGIPRRSQPLR